MDISSIALLLSALGVGGFIGAAAAAVSAGSRVAAAFAEFEAVFEGYFGDREDPESRRVRSAFVAFEVAIAGLASAFEKLRRALRIR
ncbi:MAG: hypothetical protein HZC36_04715 [Armatimonadetes bacterium]|nr:hypothetical protein [Armatimonadota bacterium]